MIFSQNNRNIIARKLEEIDLAVHLLPKLPTPGDFPPPGFLTAELPDPVADGFDKCFLFNDGMVLNTRTGFHYDKSKKLDLISKNSSLIHHYAPDGTVVSHSKYLWMDLLVYFLGVIVSR